MPNHLSIMHFISEPLNVIVIWPKKLLCCPLRPKSQESRSVGIFFFSNNAIA